MYRLLTLSVINPCCIHEKQFQVHSSQAKIVVLFVGVCVCVCVCVVCVWCVCGG